MASAPQRLPVHQSTTAFPDPDRVEGLSSIASADGSCVSCQRGGIAFDREKLEPFGYDFHPTDSQVRARAGVLEHPMSKAIAVLGSALFFVIAPLVLAGFVPWWVTQWEFRPAFFGVDLTRILGGILIIVGVPGLVDSFARFALEGLGTPAPIAPPQKLVVTGLYRYVRNPIYIAVVAVIFGQALLFGDWRLLWYGALLWLFFHVFVVMYEEPTLKQTFGTEYESFRTNVPRWIPRLTPWRAA